MRRSVRLSLLVGGLALLAHVPVAQSQAQFTVKSMPQGWLGIYMQERSIVDSTQYPVLMSVEPGSPAQSAGLVAGDTILSFNNIDARGNFRRLQRLLKPGERVTFKLRRNGVRNVSVNVATRPTTSTEVSIEFFGPALGAAIAASVAPLIPFQLNGFPGSTAYIRMGMAGAEFADITEELADAFQIKVSGVLILHVQPGTPAKEAGLKGGDVICKVDTTPVASSDALMRAMQGASNKKVTLEFVRKGKKANKQLKW